LAPFLPALGAGFVSWDDESMLVVQTGYRAPGALRWALASTVMGHWSPLAWLSFALDHRLGGLDPRVFHATSLALHGLNAALFYLLARRLLAAAGPERADPLHVVGAALAALVFAVHPLRVEPVAWISDRRDLLCATFLLLALLAYLRGVRAGGQLARGWGLASLAAFAGALGSKGIAAVLPLLFLVLDWYPLGRAPRGWLALVREKIPHLALALAGVVVTALAVRADAAPLGYGEYGPLARLALAGHSAWMLLVRHLWPVGLSPLYELPAEVRLSAPRFLLPLLAAATLTVALVRLRRRWPAGLATWLASLIVLAPVSGIVLAGRHVGADRYAYLAGLGLALLAGGGGVHLVARRSLLARRIAGAAAALLLVGLGVLSWQQTLHWRDSERLWRRAVAVEPDCASCLNNLGRALMRADGRRPREEAEAEARFRRALTLRPDQPGPYLNLGALLVGLGRLDAAEAVLREVVGRWPALADGPAGLAAVSGARGDEAAAAALLRRALALDPGFTGARIELGRLLNNRGVAAAEAGRLRESAALLRESVGLLRADPEPLRNLRQVLRALRAAGDETAAQRELEALRALDPALAEAAGKGF
jgi:tetratricopeptide (TPR) repeat protein